LANLIDVNIFSNCSRNAEDVFAILSRTVHSWNNTFVFDNVKSFNIYIHPEPYAEELDMYFKLVHGLFRMYDKPYNIKITKGLAHGYLMSTTDSTTDYIFQLEHDWRFNDTLITHSLEDILDCMKFYNIEHMRFNKKPNVDRLNETFTELTSHRVPVCKNDNQIRSNNPHIIDRMSYVNHWNKFIQINNVIPRHNPGAGGVEQSLRTVGGHIYGPLNSPPTIEHLEGRIRDESNNTIHKDG
jgi:hypothetical protein